MQQAAVLRDDGECIGLAHDEVFLAIEFEFGTGVFAIQHFVAYLENHGFVFGSFAGCEDLTAERFLLCGIGDNNAGNCFFFCGFGLDNNPVSLWFNL